jgi:hypothetical protein
MAMQLRAALQQNLDDAIRQRRRVINALPTLASIQVDEAVIHHPDSDLPGLCYTHFAGRKHQPPCAQMSIALDPDQLLRDRWLWEPPPPPARLGTTLFCALVEAGRLLGGTDVAREKVVDLLRHFGPDRRPDSYHGGRSPSPTAEQARVATAIATCLVHLIDPKAVPRDIRAFVYPLAGAQAPRRLRPASGYGLAHGQPLRKIA